MPVYQKRGCLGASYQAVLPDKHPLALYIEEPSGVIKMLLYRHLHALLVSPRRQG